MFGGGFGLGVGAEVGLLESGSELVGGALGDDSSAAEDVAAVADGEGEVDVLFDDEDADAEFGADADE